MLVSLHQDVCIDFNFIYYFLLSLFQSFPLPHLLSLFLSLFLSPSLSLPLSPSPSLSFSYVESVDVFVLVTFYLYEIESTLLSLYKSTLISVVDPYSDPESLFKLHKISMITPTKHLCILVPAPFWHHICINFLQWFRFKVIQYLLVQIMHFYGTIWDKFAPTLVLI